MNKNIQKKFFYISWILISLVIIAFTAYFSQLNCFCDDDFFYARLRPNQNIFTPLNPFTYIHGGGYIGYWLLTFFAYSFPKYIVHINPYDFITIPHGIIKGCLAVCVLSLLMMFFRQFYKGKAFWLILYLTLGSMFFYFGLWSDIIPLNYSFYRYFLSLLPFGYLMFYLYRHTTVKFRKINKPQLILACFCAYITGMSSEIEIYLTLSLLCAIILLKLLTIRFEDLKLNLGADFWIIFSVFLISMVIFTTSTGFREVADERGLNNIIINTEIIREYSALYFQNCFLRLWFLWFVLILCSGTAFYYAKKQKRDLKKLIFPLLFQFSLLAVMFSLILCGKTNYFSTYFIVHKNILSLFTFLTLIPTLILLGYCLKNIKETKLKAVLAFIILCAVCFMGANSKEIQSTYLLNLRAKTYILQKMALYEYYRTNEIYLPDTVITDYNPAMSEDFSFYEFKYNLKEIYDLSKIMEMSVKTSDDAITHFYGLGGSFGEEELGKLRFQNLNSPGFVMDKQDDEVGEEEIERIMQE